MLKIIEVKDLDELDTSEIIRLINYGYTIVVIMYTGNYDVANKCSVYLSEEQIRAMFKYKKDNDKINYGVTKAIVNMLFSKIENLEYEDITWRIDNYNKPYIKNHLGLHFNISHTSGCSIATFSEKNIGVDVENLKKDIDYKEIVNNFFASSEIVLTTRDFYKRWVSKEAYLKYKGVGLAQSLKSIEFIDGNDGGGRVIDRKSNIQKEILIFEQENFIFAICF